MKIEMHYGNVKHRNVKVMKTEIINKMITAFPFHEDDRGRVIY